MIEIAYTKTVGSLKEAIKEKKKNTFEHVDADTLILWKVDITAGRFLKKNLGNVEFTDKQKLLPIERLSEYFSEPLLQRHLHIAIKAPPPGEYS